MKKLILLPVLFALIALPLARADQKAEDAGIHQFHDRWCAAWDQHDPKIMAGVFVTEGSLINPFGRRADSRAEIEKVFIDEQSGPMVGTSYTGTIETIRYLDKKTAVVDVEGQVIGMKRPDGTVAPPFKHHVAYVLVKRDGKWMVHTSRVSVPVPTPAK